MDSGTSLAPFSDFFLKACIVGDGHKLFLFATPNRFPASKIPYWNVRGAST